MLNTRFSTKSYSYNHDFLLPNEEIIEVNAEKSEHPYEVVKPEITTIEIKLIADKISEKLVKLVEQQLTVLPK